MMSWEEKSGYTMAKHENTDELSPTVTNKFTPKIHFVSINTHISFDASGATSFHFIIHLHFGLSKVSLTLKIGWFY